MTGWHHGSIESFLSLTAEQRREAVRSLFVDVLERPSYMDSIPEPSREALKKIGDEYTAHVNQLALCLLDNRELYLGAMLGIFGNSEASELRAMLFGFKPAVFSNAGDMYRRRVTEEMGEAFAELDCPLYIFKKHWLGENFGLVKFPVLEWGHFDIAYSKRGIEGVIASYSDVLLAAGYNVEELSSADIFVDRFVQSYNPIVKSLVLGYSLASSLFFNITVDAVCHPPLGDLVLEHASRFLSEEQYRFLELVRACPSSLDEMKDLYLQSYTTSDRIHSAFDDIGLTDYIRGARHDRLGIMNFDDHV